MTESSMWLTGKFIGDNIKNVEWECNRCHACISSRDEAINHIRAEHGEGLLLPRLSKVGRELAQLHFFQDASERLSKVLVDKMEQHFCKGMGAEPVHVSKTEITSRSLNPIPDNEVLFQTVKSFIINIRHRVEQKEGYITLTNSSQIGVRVLRSEPEIQVALHDWLEPHCKYSNIDLSREPSTGRGLLDFKFSIGSDLKCLLEVKLMDSTQLQHGLEIQLLTYLQAEKAAYGIYVPIGADPITHDEKLKKLKGIVDDITGNSMFKIEMIDIKAWKLDPASVAKELTDPKRYGLS